MGGDSGEPTRPAAIGRYRHLHGAVGRDSVHRGSAVRLVESSGNPENPIGFRTRHPAAHSEKWRRLRIFAEDTPMMGESPRNRAVSDLVSMALRIGEEASSGTTPEFPIIRPKYILLGAGEWGPIRPYPRPIAQDLRVIIRNVGRSRFLSTLSSDVGGVFWR